MYNVPMDVLNLSFTVEDWLESDTAELTIDIDASADDTDSVELRSTIKDSLKKLIDTEWRFVRVRRYTDRSGREAWQVAAQARVPENEISNLGSRTKALGKVGLQFRVGNVDYSPTKEQVEELKRKMRSKVNKLITDELTALNSELSGRQWRVSTVTYDDNMSFANTRGNALVGAVGTAAMNATYNGVEADADAAEGGFGGFEVSQKVIFNTTVLLSSVVDGFESK